jgi:sensor histidine kinase YesM
MIRVAASVLLVLFLTYSIEILIFITVVPKDGNPDMTYAFDNLIKGLGYFLTANFIVAMILISLIELTRKQVDFKWWHVLMLVLICFPGSLASKIIYTLMRTGFKGGEFVDFSFMSGLANFPSLLSAMLAYGITVYISVARREHENALKAEALLNDARWQMLRYQVNPHFLFNSLSSIMTLINRDKELARSVVNELASYFRYTLSWNDLSVISLKEEIGAVTHFLEIQKIRFEDKLSYSVETDESVTEIEIPIFGLQTLVENAVKYGRKTHSGVVHIRIATRIEEEFCYISVTNTGRLWHDHDGDSQENRPGTGTGLSNLQARLNLLYSEKAGFTIREENNSVTAEIKIPAGSVSRSSNTGLTVRADKISQPDN